MIWRCFIILVLGAVAVSRSSASDEFQWRPGVNLRLYDDHDGTATLYSEARITNDALSPFGYLIAPRFSYRAVDWLVLGANFTFIESDLELNGASSQVDSYRAEFEANPEYWFTERIRFRLRNRYEHRWIPNRIDDNRTRHRAEFSFALKGLGPVQSFAIWDEIFFDWDNDRFTLNRFSPAGVGIRLTEKVVLRLAYFWERRWVPTIDGFGDAHAFYTVLDLSLR